MSIAMDGRVVVSPPLLQRLMTTRAAVSRSGVRATRAGALTIATVRQLRASTPCDPSTGFITGQAQALASFSRRLCTSHDIEIDLRGALPNGPCILAANHISYLDPLVITSVVPCVPIAKHEIGSWPIVGEGCRSLGVLLVERGLAHSGAVVLRRALQALDAGAAVLNFPEGTTSFGFGVLPFRRGVFGLAKKRGVPIIPVAIGYDCPTLAWVGNASFLPHYLMTASRRTTVAHVHFGEPLHADAQQDASQLARLARERIARMLWKSRV